MTLKIINSNNADDALREREIEAISDSKIQYRSCMILRICVDDFEITGPNRKHMCLMYKPMRRPLWIIKRRFVNRKLPLPAAKAYIASSL